MQTKILKQTKNAIALACKLLKDGEIVAIPTETVYGLAGDCRNPMAIQKIFNAKGRPQDNPLIVHISNLDMLNGLVKYVPQNAKKLMDEFWPGPLTIIMPKGKLVCTETTAGLDSVGIRMPSNEIVREIIEQSGVPFAAHSANISRKPSPTNAKDVYNDMNGKIPLVIDGAKSIVGIESTVVSCLNETPIILCPGVIIKEMIENVLKINVNVEKGITQEINNNERVLSPGMKYKHYAPNVKGSFDKFKEFVEKQQNEGLFALVFNGEVKNSSLMQFLMG